MAPTPDELVEQAKREIREVSPDEARRRIDAGAVALDVREADELAAGLLPGAAHIPHGALEHHIGAHEALADPQATVVIYCRSGRRSALAAKTLQERGYRDVASLAGGYIAWVEAGHAVQLPDEDEEE